MRPNPYILSIVNKAGLQILDIQVTGGTHIKARLKRPADGQCANFIFACTPSDRRGFSNKLSELRRFAACQYNPITRRDQ